LVPALPCGILASILSFWAFIVGCAAVGINFGLFTTARNRLRNRGATADFHNAIWMVVAATACLLLASFTVCVSRDASARWRTSWRSASPALAVH
jgi:heme/copper-type cytochrome/quinol oxidase subunit 3